MILGTKKEKIRIMIGIQKNYYGVNFTSTLKYFDVYQTRIRALCRGEKYI